MRCTDKPLAGNVIASISQVQALLEGYGIK